MMGFRKSPPRLATVSQWRKLPDPQHSTCLYGHARDLAGLELT